MAHVSIIICTRNNASSLAHTLDAISRVHVPAGWNIELIVADNGSTDDTLAVVKQGTSILNRMGITCRTVAEPRKGKGYAYNCATAEATGEVLLFTDDDVRPGPDWVEGMASPICKGDYDAIAGGVKIADELCRPWLTSEHRAWLASTDRLPIEPDWRMVGANMAISRRVLKKVPQFDVELGPGALGFGDETLFSYQIVHAGFRVGHALNVIVEHHFNPSRLTRRSMRESAAKMGRSQAYVEHHWIHYHRSLPRLKWIKHLLQLSVLRVLKGWDLRSADEGIDENELQLRREIALFARAAVEHQRARHYAERGLRPLTISNLVPH